MSRRIRKAIIVGASSGIGEALAQVLAERGARVALVARREDELARIAGEINATAGEDRAIYAVHDVVDYGAAPALMQDLARRLDGVDTVIYCAGAMFDVEPDEFDTEKDLKTLEVNTLGAFAWLNEAARRFGTLGEGSIVGISSIAGERGRRGNPAYCTSKAALSTYLESLRNRLEVKGVNVTTIKPGFIDTPMVQGRPGLIWLISPRQAAETIVKAAESGKNTVYVPGRWRFVAMVLKMIPSFIFRRLNF